MVNKNFLNGVATKLREIHIPRCVDCKREYKLKLTTINSNTQEGIGQFVPACNCS